MVKKKQVQVITWLNNGCYPGFVMFSCGFKYDEILTLLRKKKAFDWLIGLTDNRQLIEGGNYFALRRDIYKKSDPKVDKILLYIIITEQFKFTDYEICKLAHEVTHICQFFLKDILDRTKEHEAEAYYHTHIMNQCLEALRGKPKK